MVNLKLFFSRADTNIQDSAQGDFYMPVFVWRIWMVRNGFYNMIFFS